jgi:adenosylmethionine-8-amino-7-oxononanoate aminotransferase
VGAAVRERGVLLRPMVSSIGVSPPLTVTEEHLDQLLDAFAAGLDSVHRDAA